MMTMTKEERAEIAKAQSAARSRNYRERERKKKEIIIAKAKSAATSRRYRERNKQKQHKQASALAELKTTDSENCWDVHFRQLRAYLQTNGDFNVPSCYPCNPLLARWVNEQRNDYGPKRRAEQTSLTLLRKAKLDAIGFNWFVGGTEEDTTGVEGVSNGVQPEEAHKQKRETACIWDYRADDTAELSKYSTNTLCPCILFRLVTLLHQLSFFCRGCFLCYQHGR
jgi:hypothetical protein